MSDYDILRATLDHLRIEYEKFTTINLSDSTEQCKFIRLGNMLIQFDEDKNKVGHFTILDC